MSHSCGAKVAMKLKSIFLDHPTSEVGPIDFLSFVRSHVWVLLSLSYYCHHFDYNDYDYYHDYSYNSYTYSSNSQPQSHVSLPKVPMLPRVDISLPLRINDISQGYITLQKCYQNPLTIFRKKEFIPEEEELDQEMSLWRRRRKTRVYQTYRWCLNAFR